VIPRKTEYLIDKIIRKRIKEGTLKVENLEEIFHELQRSKANPQDYERRLNKYTSSKVQKNKGKKNRGLEKMFGLSYENWNNQKKVETQIRDFLVEQELRILKEMIGNTKQQMKLKETKGEKAYQAWLAQKEYEDQIK